MATHCTHNGKWQSTKMVTLVRGIRATSGGKYFKAFHEKVESLGWPKCWLNLWLRHFGQVSRASYLNLRAQEALICTVNHFIRSSSRDLE